MSMILTNERISNKMCKYHTTISKISYRNLVYIVTLISFIVIFLFLTFFAIYAPGNYFQSANGKNSILDIIFAIILLVNSLCVILSFIEFTKSGYSVCQNKHFSLKQFCEIIVGVYPIMLVFFLCDWNISSLYHYLLAPIQILLRK